MKKIIFYFFMSSFLLLLVPKEYFAADLNQHQKSSFARALETHNQNMVNYYRKNSSVVKDARADVVTVTKILRVDDPNTPENEEQIEEYESTVITAFVEFEKVRDTLFIFKNTEMYFYDIENNEFLLSGNVLANEPVKTFFEQYSQDLKGEITPFSLTLFMLLLGGMLSIPISIMIVGEKGSNHVHQKERSRYSSSI